MKAVALRGKGDAAVIDVPRPTPGPGEVVLEVHDCGICGSDVRAVQHGIEMPRDSVLGHEFSGEVHELGPGVRGFERGDRVVSLPVIACGTCEACARGDPMHCAGGRPLGFGQLPGALAEYVRCGEGSLLRLPAQVGSRQGALVEPLAVALNGVKRSVMSPGASVVVMGAGPIGLSTLLWARARGAGPVVVSEPAPGRARLALALGATAVVDPLQESPADRIRALTGRPPGIVFECVGAKYTLDAAIDLVGLRGQVVVLGVCVTPDRIMPAKCSAKEVRIDFGFAYTMSDFRETIDALAAGAIDAGPMITDVVTLDQAPEMLVALQRPGSRAKVMVELRR